MKALKIIGMVLGGLVLCVVGFFGWFYVTKVMAPEPEAVCSHTLGLMKDQLTKDTSAKLGDPALAKDLVDKQLADFEKTCVQDAARQQDFNAVAYAEEAKCTVAADSMSDLRACSKR
ncbi:MAG: hypothetical protein KC731_30510 [Myxococcales bacterium]|nr:hypothetical protein [Myxococcales bacterium]